MIMAESPYIYRNAIKRSICYGAIALLATLATVMHSKDITLFVHGTKLPGVEHINGVIPHGLHQADTLTDENHPHTTITALCTGSVPFTHADQLYFYGWDGVFPLQREWAAQELYTALCALIKELQLEEGECLHIRCIAHSHGGNVILYLLDTIDKNQSPIVIDELILLGCPIIGTTHDYIKANAVQAIYNIYSSGDTIQKLDPQGVFPESYQNEKKPQGLFSERTFNASQDNLWQIEVEVDSKEIGHLEFIQEPFLQSLAQIIQEAKKHSCGMLRINTLVEQKNATEHINLTIKK